MRRTRSLAYFLPVLALLFCTGCPVPQQRGLGKYQWVQEPVKKGGYHLYLPVDYVKNDGRHPRGPDKKWPLVMTFHGMKPYDNALPQEREWEREADTYGYIVCAPSLETCDSFMEYPLTREHSYVLRDRDRVMAIMDHVFATTKADPRAVLSTSWSCGGYLAHYFVNRYPGRFSCIATRLSNFAPEMLLEENVPKYKNMPVAIFIGDGDFPACKSESEEAVAWYMARGFPTVRGKMIDHIGHRRIPQTAAAFFAEQLNITPLHPDQAGQTVAQLQMTDFQPPAALVSRMAGRASPGSVGSTAVAMNTPRKDVTPTPPSNPPSAAASLPKASPPPPPVKTQPPPRPPVEVATNAPRGETPFNRPPVYTPPPVNNPPRPVATNTNSNGAFGTNGSRVASATPSGRNDTSRATPPRPSTDTGRSTPPRDTRVADAGRPRNSTPTGISASGAPTGRNPAPRTTGVRDNSTGASSRERVAPPPAPPPRDTVTPPPVARGATRAKKVNINLGGPAIGSTPYYLAYSVDLPASALEGADFLWMDNGVWMGDEPRGTKIIESPGLHRISVLVITKANEEYRGAASVQVMEKGPARSARAD